VTLEANVNRETVEAALRRFTVSKTLNQRAVYGSTVGHNTPEAGTAPLTPASVDILDGLWALQPAP
jgi:hypothetical protein